MATRWRSAVVAVVVAVLPVVQSCSAGQPPPTAPPAGSSTTPAPDPALTAWLGRVCLADKQVQELGMTRIPMEAGYPREQVVELLTALREAVVSSIEVFRAIGPAPTPGGDAVVDAYVTGLNELLTGVDSTIAAPAAEVDGRDLGLLLISTRLLILGPRGADLPTLAAGSPELTRAYESAFTCQRPPLPLKAPASTPPTS
ncbi:hypothetical protein LZG04_01730 [Saccharothrix sp. S26]|uniref:hypothetical protein n=1 Tax=Saccharothrix sp. S26 TaxID=2907215 RepID=UPI001F16F3DD|nr:hypothetical protein [Saccharothrix sp. S26]MCE6993533.1 hypothetical protein [Saccharothrix sp. S26]